MDSIWGSSRQWHERAAWKEFSYTENQIGGDARTRIAAEKVSATALLAAVQPCLGTLSEFMSQGCSRTPQSSECQSIGQHVAQCLQRTLGDPRAVVSLAPQLEKALDVALRSRKEPLPSAISATVRGCDRHAENPAALMDCYAAAGCRNAWRSLDSCLTRSLGDHSVCERESLRFRACALDMFSGSLHSILHKQLKDLRSLQIDSQNR